MFNSYLQLGLHRKNIWHAGHHKTMANFKSAAYVHNRCWSKYRMFFHTHYHSDIIFVDFARIKNLYLFNNTQLCFVCRAWQVGNKRGVQQPEKNQGIHIMWVNFINIIFLLIFLFSPRIPIVLRKFVYFFYTAKNRDSKWSKKLRKGNSPACMTLICHFYSSHCVSQINAF